MRITDPTIHATDPPDADTVANMLRNAAASYRDHARAAGALTESRMAEHFTACETFCVEVAELIEQGEVQLVRLPKGCTGEVTPQHHANQRTRWSIDHDGDTCPVHEGA